MNILWSQLRIGAQSLSWLPSERVGLVRSVCRAVSSSRPVSHTWTKQGPFPPQGCLSLLPRYDFPLRLPSRSFLFHLVGLIRSLFTIPCIVRGRVSLVPDIAFSTCRSPYTGEFFRVVPSSSCVPWPSPGPSGLGSLLASASQRVLLTMRQDSLHVTACGFASFACLGELFTGLQPPDFADVCLLATGRLGPSPGWTFIH